MEASDDLIPQRPDRKTRKSVSFTSETELVDANGSVTMAPANDDSAGTAQSHAPTTPPLADTLSSFNEAPAETPAADDDAAPADGDIDLLQLKKKKKKKVLVEDETGTATAPGAGPDDTGLDTSLKKKKKKKTVAEDDFTAKLKELNLEGKEGGEEAEAAAEDTGDMVQGTGIWAHDETKTISYDLLLTRFFFTLTQKNPDHALGGIKSKIPPPQCMREGNKKTIFVNIAEICKRMKRAEEHVTAYLFTELGTSGSVDGSRRLVIKGKFQAKQIEGLLRKYIIEFVSCKTCKSGDTELSKGENRLYFITCNSCGSRRSVQTIKSGFTAQIGRRKKQG